MNNSTLQAALFEALDAIRAGYPEQAVTACNELLAVYPDSVRVYRVRAQAYEGMEDWRHASEDFSRVLDIVPTDSNAIVSLARTMNHLGRTEEAQLIARQALDYAPTDEDALVLAQNIDDGDPTALKPPQPGRVLMMRQQFEFGRVSRALEALRKFAAERPHRIDARMVLAELLWRSHARIAAAELCQQILDEQPDSLPAHTLLALIWAKLGANRISEAHLRTLDRLDPDHRETREWLGDLSPVVVADVPARPQVPVGLRGHSTDIGGESQLDLVGEAKTAQEAIGTDTDVDVVENAAEHDDYVNDYIVNVGPIPPQIQPARHWRGGAGVGAGNTSAASGFEDDLDDGDGEGEGDQLDDENTIEEFSPLEWEREADLDDDDDVDLDQGTDTGIGAKAGDQEQKDNRWLRELRKAGPPAPEGALAISSAAIPAVKPTKRFKFEETQPESAEVAELIDQSADQPADVTIASINIGIDSDHDDAAGNGGGGGGGSDSDSDIADITDFDSEDEALAKTELSMLPVTPNALLDTVDIALEPVIDSTVDSGRVLTEPSPETGAPVVPAAVEQGATDIIAAAQTDAEALDERVVIIAPINVDTLVQRIRSVPMSVAVSTPRSRPERRIQQQSEGLDR